MRKAHSQCFVRACAFALCCTDNKWLYTVALPKKIVRVHEHILAPEYREGELLMYRSPDGANTPATAVATDPTYWQVLKKELCRHSRCRLM
jgi:hypothetical protein